MKKILTREETIKVVELLFGIDESDTELFCEELWAEQEELFGPMWINIRRGDEPEAKQLHLEFEDDSEFELDGFEWE